MTVVSDPSKFRANITKKLNKFIRKKIISINVEKGIYNVTIKAAKDKNVVRKWDNKFFVLLYLD